MQPQRFARIVQAMRRLCSRRQALAGALAALSLAPPMPRAFARRAADHAALGAKGRKKKHKCPSCRRCGKRCCPTGQQCAGGCVTPCSSGGCGTFPASCPLLPADNVWHARVDGLPVDAHSDAYVAAIGATAGLHPDFGARSRSAFRSSRSTAASRRSTSRSTSPMKAIPAPIRFRPTPRLKAARVNRATAMCWSSTPAIARCTNCSMPAARRRIVDGRLRRDVRPWLERAAAERMDVGRRGRIADLAGAGSFRRGRRRRDLARVAFHRAAHPRRLCLAGAP